MSPRILVVFLSSVLIVRAQSPDTCTTPVLPQSGYRVLDVGDINGDAISDYVVGSPTHLSGFLGTYSFGRLLAFSGATGAVLWVQDGYAIGASYGLALGQADTDGDGIREVLTVSQSVMSAGFAAPEIKLINPTTGMIVAALTIPPTVPWAQVGTTIDAADLDGDGKDELLLGVGGSLEAGLGQAAAPPGAALIFYPSTGVVTVLVDNLAADFGRTARFVGDVDLDGVTDFIVTAPYADSVAGPTTLARAGLIRVYSGASLTPITDHRGGATDAYLGFAVTSVGDIDADGRSDLVATRRNGTTGWSIDVFTGNTTASSPTSFPLPADFLPGQRMKQTFDLDRDGLDDLVLAGRSSSSGDEFVDVLSLSDFRQMLRFPNLPAAGTRFGFDFSSSTDTNGDGLSELLVGEPHWNNCAGRVTRHDLKPCLSAFADGSPLHDLLRVNGTAALPSRSVVLALGEPFYVEIKSDPTTAQPTDHIIWGLIGQPDQASLYPVAGGSFLFPPRIAAPGLPWLFTLTSSINYDPGVLLPGLKAPFTVHFPQGIQTPVHLTLQGVTISGGNIDITNGILIVVR